MTTLHAIRSLNAEATRVARRRPSARKPDDARIDTVGPADNIFAVLARPAPEELLAKAELARAVRRVVHERGLTQAAAARILGVSQPDVSDLVRGRLAGFSVERLSRLLTVLGQDVRILVQPKPTSRKTASFRAHVRAARE